MKVWKYQKHSGASSNQKAMAALPWPPILAALAGILLTYSAFYILKKSDARRVEAEFIRRSDSNASQLKSGIAGYQEILKALRTLFLFSSHVTLEEFQGAAEEISRRFKGIQALQWVQVVPGEERAAHEELARSLGLENYEIRDRGRDGNMLRSPARETYQPIFYIQPLEGNERALGYDLASGPTIADLNLARDTGAPTLSPKLTLVQESDAKPAIIFIVPVYKTVEIPPTVEERRRDLCGFIQGVFIARDMLSACFPRGLPEGIHLAIYDSNGLLGGNLLYGKMRIQDRRNGAFELVKDLPINNRAWSLVYTPDPKWLKRYASNTPYMALFGGAAFTGLAFAYLRKTLQQSQVAERLVRRRTLQLERTLTRLEREIHDRRQREVLLSESEGRYRSLFDLSPDGIAIVKNQVITLANRALLRLCGMPPETNLEGDPFFDHVMPEDRLKIEDLMRVVQETGDSPPFCRVQMLTKCGNSVETELRASQVVSGGDQAVQLVLRDISARLAAEAQQKALEAQFQEAQKLESLGVLAGGIAHDFNNLLTGVIGNASLIKAALSPRSPQNILITAIENSASRAADLCRQMLAYSGRGKVQIQPLSLTDLIEETTPLLQLSISKKATLRFDIDSKLPAVMADITQMRQVIMNLIINASDSLGDKPGLIMVKTEAIEADSDYLKGTLFTNEIEPGPYIAFEVADNGQGMNQATLARIFEPFFTTKFTGRGLGLSAVMGIVKSHNGTMKVYSEPGRGTSFKLLLPVCKEDAMALPSQESLLDEWVGHGKILLIDDEAMVREVTSGMLELMGFEVIEAVDGIDGLECYKKHMDSITIVLVDLTMPRLDGFGTFRALRKLKQDIRIILISGFNEQEAISQFYGKGLSGFVQKPFRLSHLRKALKNALEPA